MTADAQPPQTPDPLPVSVQILSTVLFAGFAIPVTIVALNVFWPAGVAIAVILAWRGGFAPTGAPAPAPANLQDAVRSLAPTTAQKTSGNASFDAYRSDLLQRLEAEQNDFEGFLTRLRDAKGKAEFDQFMDDRATRLEARFDAD